MAKAEASTPHSTRGLSRQILGLAIPALGALIAEPLFLLADTAMIGRLGTAELAGVGLAAAIVQTATGLLIFLAYSTTPAVARYLGAGRIDLALARGRDGIWLGLLIGCVLGLAGWFGAPALISALTAGSEAPEFIHAVHYIQYSMIGLPAMLAVLAATGVLRGLQDTKTPLYVATGGFGLNVIANFILIYGVGWGVIGSAVGTSLAQWAMLAVFLLILIPRMREEDIRFTPAGTGMRATAQVGSWLLLRSASLRVAILVTVLTATSLGTEVLAAHQLVFALFTTLAFALDALAIAAQALIGKELGAGDHTTVRWLTRIMIRWSLWFGLITGALLASTALWLPRLFTTDETVIHATTAGLFVLALSQPIAGYVFVLDGILMGAGDAKYLGLIGVANLVIYLPALYVFFQISNGAGAITSVIWVWVGFAGVSLCARALGLWLRIRGDGWIRLGIEATE